MEIYWGNKKLHDISELYYYEDRISDWYAFFLTPMEKHGFGNLFLQCLIEEAQKVLSNYEFKITENIDVRREKKAKNSREKIDIVIKGKHEGKEKGIMIESKIFAGLYNNWDVYFGIIDLPIEDKICIIMPLLRGTDTPDKRFIFIEHSEWMSRVSFYLEEIQKGDNVYFFNIAKEFISHVNKLSTMSKAFWRRQKESKNFESDKINAKRNYPEWLLQLRKSIALEITSIEYNKLGKEKSGNSVLLQYNNSPVYIFISIVNIYDNRLEIGIAIDNTNNNTESNWNKAKKELVEYSSNIGFDKPRINWLKNFKAARYENFRILDNLPKVYLAFENQEDYLEHVQKYVLNILKEGQWLEQVKEMAFLLSK